MAPWNISELEWIVDIITSRRLLIFPEISGNLTEILNFRKIYNRSHKRGCPDTANSQVGVFDIHIVVELVGCSWLLNCAAGVFRSSVVFKNLRRRHFSCFWTVHLFLGPFSPQNAPKPLGGLALRTSYSLDVFNKWALGNGKEGRERKGRRGMETPNIWNVVAPLYVIFKNHSDLSCDTGGLL